MCAKINIEKENKLPELVDLYYNIKILQTQSWNEAIFGKANDANELCKKGIELSREYQKKRPFAGKLLELEFRKNRVYALQYDDKQNPDLLRNECEELLHEAELIYKENPGNRIIHDIIGFSCNLYCTYTLKYLQQKQKDLSLEAIEMEKAKMFWIVNYGLEVRKQIFEKYPNDIWAIRGYAWSLHTKARLYMDMGEKLDVAKDLLDKARDLRNKEKNRMDIGLYEDLIDNYIDLFKVRGGKSGGTKLEKEISQKVQKLINEIREKARNSVRFHRLLDKLHEEGLGIE